MRRVIIWLCIALCTFAIGFTVAMLWKPRPRVVGEPKETPLPILAYCELVNNPDRYNGKVIRVRATLGAFGHGILFADENCPSQTAVGFLQSNDEVRRALTEAAGSEYIGHVELDLIVVGRFEKVIPSNESDGIWHTAPLHFEIMRVEEASKAR